MGLWSMLNDKSSRMVFSSKHKNNPKSIFCGFAQTKSHLKCHRFPNTNHGKWKFSKKIRVVREAVKVFHEYEVFHLEYIVLQEVSSAIIDKNHDSSSKIL